MHRLLMKGEVLIFLSRKAFIGVHKCYPNQVTFKWTQSFLPHTSALSLVFQEVFH